MYGFLWRYDPSLDFARNLEIPFILILGTQLKSGMAAKCSKVRTEKIGGCLREIELIIRMQWPRVSVVVKRCGWS